MHDFLVIGGSISAFSTALVLRQKLPKAKIAVVGKFMDPNSATLCAGAMINCFAELPYNAFDYEPMKKKYEFALRSWSLWPKYVDLINQYSDIRLGKPEGRTYCLLNSNSTRIERKTFDYILKTAALERDDIFEVDPDTIKALKPTDLGRTIRAMQVPDARINPHTTISALMSALPKLEIELINDTVIGCESEFLSGRVKEAVLKSGSRIEAKEFVLANGFDQNMVAKTLKKAKILPVLANGGAALRLTVPDWVREKGGLGRDLLELKDVIRTVDRGGACGIHIVPNGDGSFYLGASSAVWPNYEFKPKLAAVQVLMNSAINEISYELFHYDVQLIGNGFRPATPDCFPIIGGTRAPNLWVNNGMKRDGFTSSWATAEYLVEGMLGDRKDWGIFSPERSLLSYKTRDQAMEAALEVMYGSFIQHYGIQMPLRIPAEMDRQRKEIESTYRRVRGDFGIHPEMLHIYADEQNFKIIEPYL